MIDLNGTPVLLTGGSGFVGSHLAAGLAAAGARVRALVRRQGDHPGLGSAGITQMEGDFVNPETSRGACEGMALVVHCAATIGADLEDALRVNGSGTAALAAAARAAGCRRFVHISTLSVYDWGRVGAIVDESAPLKREIKAYPHSPAASPHYGLSKAEAERALAAERERGLQATVFRLGAVLGVHPTSCWAIQVPEKVRAGRVPVASDDSDVLPWTHIENVRHALALALAQPVSEDRDYNLLDGHVPFRRYVEDVRGWFADALPAPVIPRETGTAPAFIGQSSADRIRSELGYTPLRTYEDGMAEAAAWWRERG